MLICPIVGDGDTSETGQGGQRPKVNDYGIGSTNFIPVNKEVGPTRGKAIFNWCLCVAAPTDGVSDWAAADADPEIKTLLSATVNDKEELIQLLRTTRVSDLSVNGRNRIASLLTEKGVDISAITASTRLIKIIQLARKHFFGFEGDEAF